MNVVSSISTRVVIAALCISMHVSSRRVAINACWNFILRPKNMSVHPIRQIKAIVDGRREVNSDTYPCG